MLPVGSPAVGRDFMNREDEIRNIIKALDKDNILLIAPRRYGKTSIMKKVESILNEKDDTPVIFIDIHDVYTPQEFLVELATGAFDMARDKWGFTEKLKSFFSGILKDMEELKISFGELKVEFKRSLRKEIGEGDWKEEGRTLFTFMREYFSGTVYFIVDEFSECVHNMNKKGNEAEIFLKWFRSVRNEEDNLRFIMGGSVSIDRVVRNVTALSAINDLRRIPIDGFPEDTALHIVEKVFEEEEWEYTDNIGRKIIECIGVPSVPYFLSVFLSIIQEESLGRNLDERSIEELYNNNLMGANGKHYFDYYVQRLKIYYRKKEEKATKAILKELCRTNEIRRGVAFDIFKKATNSNDYEWFVDLISDLENDFYLKQKGDTIVFYSKTLADWWRLYYV